MIFKKSITIAIALIFIISLNTYFNGIMEKYVNEINDILEQVKQQIKDEKIDEKTIQKMDEIIAEAEKKLVLCVDHEEIEKVEIEITLLKTNIETNNYDSAIEKIEKAKYMFNHIKENSKLKIKNIF